MEMDLFVYVEAYVWPHSQCLCSYLYLLMALAYFCPFPILPCNIKLATLQLGEMIDYRYGLYNRWTSRAQALCKEAWSFFKHQHKEW